MANPTTRNIIILQSQSIELPSVTYAQLPYAHYVLVRSQANPNEFQIVSELTPATSYPTYLSRGPVQTMEFTDSLHTNPNATALQIPAIPVLQTNTSSFPHQIQVGDGNCLENNACEMEEDEFYEVQRGSAFRNTLLYSDFRPRSLHHDLNRFLSKLSSQIKFKILNLLTRFRGLKIWSSIEVEYVKPDDNTVTMTRFLTTKAQTVFNDFELDELVRNIMDQTIERNANFIQLRSGLVVNKVKCASIHVAQHLPLAGAAYKPLPKFILDKHAVINVQNTDDRCLGFSVLSMLHPQQSNPQRPNHYNNLFQTRNLNQLNYPIEQRKVPQVEDTIAMNINIYGFSHEGIKRFPIYLSKKQYPISINLLYWDGHYAWIKDFPALFFDVSKHEHVKHFCHNCLGPI